MFQQNQAHEKSVLLKSIGEVSFVLQDLCLYLDTHPEDCAALDYYQQCLAYKEQLEEIYCSTFGPLTLNHIQNCQVWSWTEEAWPWEGDCSCGTMKSVYSFQ
ncbi:hypothetical protein FACS189418_8140 [Clostridia bacterium]|nr:hypothetical protein FACS189418_8140 [Clostridia bacterium]